MPKRKDSTPDLSVLPAAKVPRRFKKFVKEGGKVFSCRWCGTTSTKLFCSTYCEEQADAYFEV